MIFLTTNKSERAGFINRVDREFFSVPVEVILHHSNLSTPQLTYVSSPLQGGIVYPVAKSSLKGRHALTRRQFEAARKVPQETS